MAVRSHEPLGFDRLELPAIWQPEGTPLPRGIGPHAVRFRAIWVPDDYDGPMPGYPWIEFGRMTLAVEAEATRTATDHGAGHRRIASGGEVRGSTGQSATAPALEGWTTTSVTSRQGGEGPPVAGVEDTRFQLAYGHAHPDVGAAIEAWNALLDLRTTLAQLDALTSPSLLARAQNISTGVADLRRSAISLARTTVLPGEIASIEGAPSDWAGPGGVTGAGVAEKYEGFQFAGATYPIISAADLLSDGVGGGHTIDRHIGKTPSDLGSRLSQDTRLKAASTYKDLAEATAVTQHVLDANGDRIALWLTATASGNRIVVSMSHPVGSRQYAPVGLVLSRDSPIAVPGNGATVVLQRDPVSSRGFTVITSYPTLSGASVED